MSGATKPEEPEPTVEVSERDVNELHDLLSKKTAQAAEEEKSEALEAIFDLASEATWDDVPSTYVAQQLAEQVGLDAALDWANQEEDIEALGMLAHLKGQEAERLQAAQAKQDAKIGQEIQKAGREFIAQVPEHLRPAVAELVARSGTLAETPEQARGILETSLRGAREVEVANREAAINAEAFGDDEFRQAHFMGDGMPGETPDDYRQAEYLRTLGATVNPNRVRPPRTAEEIGAEIHRDLFESHSDKVAAAWNLGGDSGQRKTEEYAHKRGLSPLDPKVQQYARKRGWL